MEDRTILRLKDLQVRSRDRNQLLLDCKELSLHANEILGVCGRSGVGKSLLLKTVTLVTPFDPALSISGSIDFYDQGHSRDLLKLNKKEMRSFRAAHFGMITQEPASSFNPSFTIGRHLKDILSAALSNSISDPAHYLQQVDLGDESEMLRRYPAELSGGQLQRISVACALAQNADIILCDEPTSSLDVKQRDRFFQLIRRLKQEFGKSFMVVSHDLAALEKYCDRVVTLTNADQKEAFDGHSNPGIANSQQHKNITKANEVNEADSPILSINNLSYAYQAQAGRHKKVLEDIQLNITQPGIYAIIGASGCGKTTLARIISGDYEGYEGSLTFKGVSYRDVTRKQLPDIKRSVQYVFQDALQVLNPAYTAGELLLQAHRDALIHQVDKPRKGLESICSEYRIPFHLMTNFPSQLSGGERQRINLARALLYRPSVLILDEPLSGIDAQDKGTFYDWLQDLFAEHRTVALWITHDLSEVAQVADYLYVMDSGRIVEEGPPENILKKPVHHATISLLDASIGT